MTRSVSYPTARLAAMAVGLVYALMPVYGAAQSAPIQLYFENFENRPNPTTTAQAITAYTGAAAALNETYNTNASPFWNSGAACNGVVVNNTSSGNFAACSQRVSVGQLAQAMGCYHQNPPNSTTCNTTAANSESVLAAYTSANSASGSNVELITNTAISIPGTGQRYITFGVDTMQTSCPGDPAGGGINFSGTNPAQYNFYLISSGGATTQLNSGGVVNGCTGGTPIQPGGTTTSQMYRAKSILANSPLLVNAGTSYNLRVDNTTTSGTGNDGALDNLVLYDVTPALTKSFSPATIPVGGVSTLTLTVTNTTDYLAKNGFSITDSLPTGMIVASPPNNSSTCNSPTYAGMTAGSTSFTVGGNLLAGSANAICTFKVNVTVPATSASPGNGAGSYTNNASNIPASTGVDLTNTTATLTVAPTVNVAIIKTDNLSGRYSPGGSGIYTITITNTGPSTASSLAFNDPLPNGVSLSGTWTCSGAGGSLCGAGSTASGTTLLTLNSLSLSIPPGTAPPGSSTAITIQIPVTFSSSVSSY